MQPCAKPLISSMNIPPVTNHHLAVTSNHQSAGKILGLAHTVNQPVLKLNSDLSRNKANLRDLIAATSLVILLKFEPNHRFFCLCDLEIWWMTTKNDKAPLPYYIKLCASFQIHRWIQTKVTVRKRSILVKIGDFFVPCDLEIWRMTLKNNTAPLLCCFKLCASFHSHQWIQTRFTVRKCPIWVKINVFLPHVTLKFNRWPWKKIGHLFYTTSSFVHHFKAMDEFKLELQSGNVQFGSKSAIFCPLWPWNLTDYLEKQ